MVVSILYNIFNTRVLSPGLILRIFSTAKRDIDLLDFIVIQGQCSQVNRYEINCETT